VGTETRTFSDGVKVTLTANDVYFTRRMVVVYLLG